MSEEDIHDKVSDDQDVQGTPFPSPSNLTVDDHQRPEARANSNGMEEGTDREWTSLDGTGQAETNGAGGLRIDVLCHFLSTYWNARDSRGEWNALYP